MTSKVIIDITTEIKVVIIILSITDGLPFAFIPGEAYYARKKKKD
jgi:hypothetical protein